MPHAFPPPLPVKGAPPIQPRARPADQAEQEPGVREFCAARGLDPYLPGVLALVSESFDVAGPIRLTTEEDAETGERWIEIGVAVRGESAQVLDAYDRYTDRWLNSVPPPIRESFRLAWRLA